MNETQEQQLRDNMHSAIHAYCLELTGQEPTGAIVVIADTTPLDAYNNEGHSWTYKHGGYFACEGLLATEAAKIGQTH